MAKVFANRYLIQETLGTGGMGSVYLANDRFLDNTPIALKILHRSLTENTEFVQRFLREMQTMRLVNHNNVIRIFDTGEHNRAYYYSMEYLQGKTLSEVIDNRDVDDFLPKDRIFQMAKQILSGLNAVHEANLVHRDLKPDNLLLVNDDVVKLADFGIVKTTDSRLTETQVVLGTPQYIAPEIWQGLNVGFHADIYALGVVFFELFTNRLPFAAESPAHLMKMHLMQPPPSALDFRNDLPNWVDTLLRQMLAKKPEDRPENVASILAMFNDPPKSSLVAGGMRVKPQAPDSITTQLSQSLRDQLSASVSAPSTENSYDSGRLQKSNLGGSGSAFRAMPMTFQLEDPLSGGRNRRLSSLRMSMQKSKKLLPSITPLSFLLVLALLATGGFMAFPQGMDWLDYRYHKIFPKSGPQIRDEFDCVEQFVGTYWRDRGNPEKVTVDYDLFLRQYSVYVQPEQNDFKHRTLPATDGVLLFSTKSPLLPRARGKGNK